MPETPLFTEKQRFTQWWIIVPIIGMNIIAGLALWSQLATEAADNGWVISAVIVGATLFFSTFFLWIHLQTAITKKGILVRFYPFRTEFHPWETIASMQIREYRPIIEYGGWGMRGLRKNRALNISGNIGLQLVFTDGKKLLVGTQNPEALARAVQDAGQTVH